MTKRTYHVDDLKCDHCAHRIDEELKKQSKGKVHFYEDTGILEAEEGSLSEDAIEKIVLSVVPTVHMHPIKREIRDDYHLKMPQEEWDNFSFQGHMCSHCAMKIEDDLCAMDDVQDVKMDAFAGTLSLKSSREFSPEELEKIVRRHEDGVTVHREGLPEVWESYILENLGRQNCAMKIEKEIEALDGVEEAQVDFVSQTLRVRSTRKLTPQEVEQIARRHESEIHVRRQGAEQKKILWNAEIKKDTIRLAVSIALFIVAVLSKGAMKLPFYIAAYLVAGYPVLFQAGRNLFSGALFDENFLMSIATFGALALKNYPEAVGVMIFYSVGELFEEMAVHRSRESIKALMDIRPQVARLKTESGWVDADPEDIPVGSTILIKPGEMVPIDGVIVEGETVLDLRDITGEPVPQEVGPEARITSGSINLSGAVELKTTVPYREATVAKILQLVEDSRKTKSPTEKFITKFARVYTPIVVFSAIALAAIPPIFFGEPFSEWLSRALIFLIISCPCALVTSVPLGFFGGMGAASKEGILIKGSNHVETLQNLQVAVFDKTGTITKGQFYVKEIIGEALSEEEILRLAAIGEQHSNHPIAISIVSRYGKGNLPEPGNLKETVAGGVDYFVNGVHYFLGNARFLKSQGIDVPDNHETGTIVHLASEKWLGSIILEDEVKEGSKSSIKALQDLGIRCVMLTGDGEERAKQVADAVGLQDYQAEMLPAEKLDQVKRWQQEGVTAFLGDGTNDAPAMIQADVGIGMGGVGSDAAMEAADVVFMTDELSKLPQAISMSKKIKHIVVQNIVFALGVKMIFLIMGAFGVATMWQAIFADVGVMIIAVLNSMRTMRIR